MSYRRAPRRLNPLIITRFFAQQERKGCGFVAVCALLLGLVAAGCGKGGRGKAAPTGQGDQPAGPARSAESTVSPVAALLPSAPVAPNRAPPVGGTLRVHLEAEPPHLNPLLDVHQVIGRVVTGLVYETLLECRETGYQPALAESWQVSEDGLRVLFKLRPGVRFHDERPLTAIDIQASFESVLRSTSRLAVLRSMLAEVEAVEVLPDRTVRLKLTRPSQMVLRAACELPIVPAEPLRAGGGPLAALGRHPVGTGPFRFVAWDRGKRIRLARAWPSGGQSPAQPSPFLDEIVFEIDNDGARALARVRRGEIHVLPRVLDVHYPDQVAPAALRDTLELYRLAPARYSFLVVNHRRPLLADGRFRRALAMLWDRERRAADAHRGLARPIGGPPFGPSPPLAHDRAGAIRLLEEAGHRDSNGDGVRDEGGAPLRFTLLQTSGARALATEARAFAQDLRRAGLLLDTVTVDPATLMTRLKQGDFDLAPLVWEGLPDDDPRPLFGAQGPFNFTGHRSDRLEALLDELRLADGPAARAPVLARIGALLADEQPVIFLYRHDVAALASKRVGGLWATGDRIDLRGAWISP